MKSPYLMSGFRIACLATLFACGIARHASSDIHISAEGGAFVPWDGETGYSVSGQVAMSFASERLRLGLEFEYREFENDDERYQTFQTEEYEAQLLRLVVSFHPQLDLFLSPYVGIGVGVGRHFIQKGNGETEHFAAGGFLMLGAERALTRDGRLSLYGETRFNADFDFDAQGGDDASEFRSQGAGGFTAAIGLRLRF